jgi:methylthioribose-1-phosphate isomerase
LFFLVRVWKELISSLAVAMTTTVVASSVDPRDGGVAALQAIRYTRGRGLQLLDQRKLPLEVVYIEIQDATAGWQAIKDMVVRGAPAIAIAAALSLAVEVETLKSAAAGNSQEAVSFLQNRLDYLVSSRPTAVNLADAARTLLDVARKTAIQNDSATSVYEAYLEATESMLAADVASNKAIGAYGAEALYNNVGPLANSHQGLRVLTHCNTGRYAH